MTLSDAHFSALVDAERRADIESLIGNTFPLAENIKTMNEKTSEKFPHLSAVLKHKKSLFLVLQKPEPTSITSEEMAVWIKQTTDEIAEIEQLFACYNSLGMLVAADSAEGFNTALTLAGEALVQSEKALKGSNES